MEFVRREASLFERLYGVILYIRASGSLLQKINTPKSRPFLIQGLDDCLKAALLLPKILS